MKKTFYRLIKALVFFSLFFILSISPLVERSVYAVVLPSSIYVSGTQSGKISTAWQFVTTEPGTSNTATIDTYNKNTGYLPFLAGVNSQTITTLSTTPRSQGWMYDTPLDSTIPAGNWTFNIATTNSTTKGSPVGHIVVCPFIITISGGAVATSSQIASCTEGTTNVLANTTTNFASSVTISNVSAVSFSATKYLYVDYYLRVTSATTSTTASISFNTDKSVATPANSIVFAGGASSNLPPSTPTQNSPANNAIGVSTTPNFLMTATDPESDNLGYKVTIYTGSNCTGTSTVYDQGSSSTGWTSTNATCTNSPTSCYTSGTQGNFTVQAGNALSAGVSYWWKASAKDPDGSGSFTDSSCSTFQTAGNLSMSTPTSASLNAVTLAASVQNGTGSLGTITVSDARGTNVGWTLTASSTDFTASTHTIAVTNFTINPGSVTLNSGSLTGVSAGSSHTFTSTSDNATLMSASSGNGNGSYSVNPSLTLSVPVGSYAGSYTATITETVQ